MTWDQLSINKPHLVYIILGGFTSLFMLCSSVIKERLYIGEATVATICGIIFGPHAANLINPGTWGNTDQITEEFSRLVLVVQCFAVGVELPKYYMERHWISVTMLLVPVMTFGWLITSLFVWWLFGNTLDWLDSLCVAACVTATDPVLASSVVGKGKFARRVPKHLRDLLSAESGCNDGMAFPFIYLALYIIRYRPDADKIAFHWFCNTILYECIWGATYGVLVGYAARRAIRYAHERDLIDRESFLVFYFVLALFCAGSGSLLGMDDLLIGFACGVGFSNDGWFLEKTEESHVSNVIDLLINLAFFVYFGTIIPWDQYNSSTLGISPWRLVVLGIMVIFFRRIPIMLAMKPLIPDIKTWREALFAGHFGPIGVGAIFVAILARAELETEETTPLDKIPPPGFPHRNIIELIWPITTFLVIVSIVIHGSSIAVFTLGKHINTLTISLSYTQGMEEPTWMDRLPRIQSRSKSSMSLRRMEENDSSLEEKLGYATGDNGLLSPNGLPKDFLRRQKHDEEGRASRNNSRKPFGRRRRDPDHGAGGPISQSAITPISQSQGKDEDPEKVPSQVVGEEDEITPVDSSEGSSENREKTHEHPEEPGEEIYEEGDDMIIEDEDGEVKEVLHGKGESEKERIKDAQRDAAKIAAEEEAGIDVPEREETAEPRAQQTNPRDRWLKAKNVMQSYTGMSRRPEEAQPRPNEAPSDRKRGPALAYQYGNTVIIEDEDGEVIEKFDIPAEARHSRPSQGDRKASFADPMRTRERMQRIGSMFGLHGTGDAASPSVAEPTEDEAGPSTKQTAQASAKVPEKQAEGGRSGDDRIRYSVTAGGRRMSKVEFVQHMQQMDPKSRAQFAESSDVGEAVKEQARKGARDQRVAERKAAQPPDSVSPVEEEEEMSSEDEDDYIGTNRGRPPVKRMETSESTTHQVSVASPDSLETGVPSHAVSDDLARFSFGRDTAAARRRRNIAQREAAARRGEGDAQYEGIERSQGGFASQPHRSNLDEVETAAERKRRLGALGVGSGVTDESSSSEDEGPAGTGLRDLPQARLRQGSQQSQQQQEDEETAAEEAPRPGIRFAEAQRPTGAGGNGREIRRPGPAASSSRSTNTNTGASSGGGGFASRLRWGASVGKEKRK